MFRRARDELLDLRQGLSEEAVIGTGLLANLFFSSWQAGGRGKARCRLSPQLLRALEVAVLWIPLRLSPGVESHAVVEERLGQRGLESERLLK